MAIVGSEGTPAAQEGTDGTLDNEPSLFSSLGCYLSKWGCFDEDCLPGLLPDWGLGRVPGKRLQHTTVYKVTWWL